MKQRVFPETIGLGLIAAFLGSVVILQPKALAETAPVPEPIWYNCLSREVFSPEKQTWCQRWQTLQNATYTVPANLDPDPEYISVTLENGRYQQEDGQLIVELVNEKGWIAFGDLNEDGREDAAVIFGVALDPEGRAVATYLTTVLDVEGAAQALFPIKLGERIMLNAPIAITQNRVVIPFLTATEVINRAYGIDGMTLTELELPSP